MKEISIEEKAKLYDEVRDKIALRFGTNVAKEIFSQFEESEDERMIKFIKNQLFNIKKTITDNYELDAKLTKAIDWLERQGENGANGNEREIPIPEPPLTIKHAKEVMGIKQDDAWSEEDEKCLENAIMYCKWARDIAPNLYCCEISEKSINWLKSLKERYTWKHDAFIEKACSMLKELGIQNDIIEQFKNKIK